MSIPTADSVDILILGAGWTSTFLIPLCIERSISYAATSRTGRDGTIKWEFSVSEVDDHKSYDVLPDARTVLITFPIEGEGASGRLLHGYMMSRKQATNTGFIQLGSSGIWDDSRTKTTMGTTKSPSETQVKEAKWYDRHTPYELTARARAEDDLLSLSSFETPTTVLNLAGLYGGTRSPRNWVQRVAPSKETLRGKGSLHLIHGIDLARAILAIRALGGWEKAKGQRWLLTDGRIYDWWDLASAWGLPKATGPQEQAVGQVENDHNPYAGWVRELMLEESVRALPRGIEQLGRGLDSREFWYTFQISPLWARLE